MSIIYKLELYWPGIKFVQLNEYNVLLVKERSKKSFCIQRQQIIIILKLANIISDSNQGRKGDIIEYQWNKNMFIELEEKQSKAQNFGVSHMLTVKIVLIFFLIST